MKQSKYYTGQDLSLKADELWVAEVVRLALSEAPFEWVEFDVIHLEVISSELGDCFLLTEADSAVLHWREDRRGHRVVLSLS